MCCYETTIRRTGRLTGLLVALVPLASAADPGDFLIGAGAETDSEDGLAVSVLGDLAIGDKTWLSAGVSHSGVDLPVRQEVDYLYADIGLDHHFDPVGIRFGLSYWGDSDILDSNDLRGSIYSRGDSGTLSVDGEYREFDFNIPALDVLPRATVGFDAKGIGLSGRVDVSDSVSLSASGISYEYSRDFDVGDAARVVDLLTFTRLSVLSSLVDWRGSAGIGIDMGLKRLQFDVSRWRGVVDRSDNFGITLRYMAPMSRRTDIELSIGYDDSDLYGDVTFLSLFVYLYGGN